MSAAPSEELVTHLLILGSNVEPETYLPQARAAIGARVSVLATSAVFVSPAVGAPGTPDFHNQALAITAEKSGESLRAWLREIEADLHRVRSADRNAPRTIDIDRAATFVDGLAVADPPVDPELTKYAHLYLPAAEALPDARLTANGPTLADLAASKGPIPAEFSRIPCEE